jgi:hypothetical protein
LLKLLLRPALVLCILAVLLLVMVQQFRIIPLEYMPGQPKPVNNCYSDLHTWERDFDFYCMVIGERMNIYPSGFALTIDRTALVFKYAVRLGDIMYILGEPLAIEQFSWGRRYVWENAEVYTNNLGSGLKRKISWLGLGLID